MNILPKITDEGLSTVRPGQDPEFIAPPSGSTVGKPVQWRSIPAPQESVFERSSGRSQPVHRAPRTGESEQLFPIASYAAALTDRIPRLHEFVRIAEIAAAVGIGPVWLAGASATDWAEYVHWDLRREAGDEQVNPARFNYNWVNVFERQHALQLVADCTSDEAAKLSAALRVAMPHLAGAEGEGWRVATMNSYVPPSASVCRGLLRVDPEGLQADKIKTWGESSFLQDSYGKVARYEGSANTSGPEIFSVLEFLRVVGRYRLQPTEPQFALIKSVVSGYAVDRDLKGAPQRARLQHLLRDLPYESMDALHMEHVLERVGLVTGDNMYEPLSGFAPGMGLGVRPGMLGVDEVSHGILNGSRKQMLSIFDMMTRSPDGTPNIMIRSENGHGSGQVFGVGHYVAPGDKGWSANNPGFDDSPADIHFPTVHYRLDSMASGGTWRMGRDFTVNNSGDYRIKNRDALHLIPFRSDVSVLDYFEGIRRDGSFAPSELQQEDYLGRLIRNKAQWMQPAEFAQITDIARDVASADTWGDGEQFLIKEWLAIYQAQPHRDPAFASECRAWTDRLIDTGNSYICQRLIEEVLVPALDNVAAHGDDMTRWRRALMDRGEHGDIDLTVLAIERLFGANAVTERQCDNDALFADLGRQCELLLRTASTPVAPGLRAETRVQAMVKPLRAHLLSTDCAAREFAAALVNRLIGLEGSAADRETAPEQMYEVRAVIIEGLLDDAELLESSQVRADVRRWIALALAPPSSGDHGGRRYYQFSMNLFAQPALFMAEGLCPNVADLARQAADIMPHIFVRNFSRNDAALSILEKGEGLKPIVEALLTSTAAPATRGLVERELVEMVLSRPAVLCSAELPVASYLRRIFRGADKDVRRALTYHVLTSRAVEKTSRDVQQAVAEIRRELLRS